MINIKHLTKLSALDLSTEEEILYEKSISDILNTIDNIAQVQTDNITPMTTCSIALIVRDDISSIDIDKKDLLSNCPSCNEDYIIVQQFGE